MCFPMVENIPVSREQNIKLHLLESQLSSLENIDVLGLYTKLNELISITKPDSSWIFQYILC